MPQVLGVLNKIMHIRPMQYHLAYSKPLINVSCYLIALLLLS